MCAIIVFIIALIISIIRILIDFNYGIERISPLIPVLDIASAIVWVICIVVNCVLYQKKGLYPEFCVNSALDVKQSKIFTRRHCNSRPPL